MTRNAAGILLGAVLALGLPSGAAVADTVFFKTPSGNIFCGYFDYDNPPMVRCDITRFTPTLRSRPADCDLEWGDAFEVDAESDAGGAVCHGDTVMSPEARVLAYGRSFAAGGIVCVSETHGLTCTNGKGHGFFLSKARQRVF
jgi:hypothetical protein